MGTVHFLNVKNGDCSIIQHLSGRTTVVDICNGNDVFKNENLASTESLAFDSVLGNFNQKNNPVNPIEYISNLGIQIIHRFILTHPDMDHMDGIKTLFNSKNVLNFWDIKNNKTIQSQYGQYNYEDWLFYKRLHTKALFLHYGCKNLFYNQDRSYGEGDFLKIIGPTRELVDLARKTGNYNDASYVILYYEAGRKILFTGDSEKQEWDVLLEKHEKDLRNIDVLLAPHHGRKSGGNSEFLDVLNPKLTLFGNAKSKDLNYTAWNNRKLIHYTNNQGGTFIINVGLNGAIDVYCTCKAFAEGLNEYSFYSKYFDAYYIRSF